MKTKSLFAIMFLFFVLISAPAWATTYYVDYTGGNDTNAGTSTANVWKHAPGDAQATGVPATIVLQPGDSVLFKGGINYRGSISIKHNGAAGNPIIYKGEGWPGLESTKAIIDGSEVVTATWTKCASQAEAGGNSNWDKIWYAYIPGGNNAYFVNIFEDDSFCHVAQYPIPADPFFDDNVAEYLHPESITRTSLTDSRLESFGGANLIGKRVYIRKGGNTVDSFKITGYIQAENKITFADIGADPWTDYALANYIKFIDSAGKYTYEEIAQPDSTHKIYLWPSSTDPNNAQITYTKRNYGIKVNGRSNVTVNGFRVQKFGASGALDIGIGSTVSALNITISNNIVEKNRGIVNGCWGGIYLNNPTNAIVENNLIQLNPKHKGIFINGGTNIIIRSNTMIKNGSTGILTFTVNNCQILDNIISDCLGNHTNGMAIYMNSTNILIARNKIIKVPIGIVLAGTAYEDKVKNMIIYNNVVDGKNIGEQLLRNDTDAGWPIIVCNNTLVGDNAHFSVSYHRDDRSGYIIKNNIADGMSGYTEFKRSNNLYVGISWQQDPLDGWFPGPGDVIDFINGKYVAVDQTTVMVDPLNSDYRLKSGSRAINAGVDVASYLNNLAKTDADIKALLDLFPDFDWTLDIAGNKRGQGGAWDIGAYEYVTQQQVLNLASGWNWISFNVLPGDISLSSVFAGILSQVEQVKSQDKSAIRSTSAWKGDLANMNSIGQFKMFKVKVSAPCTLTVTGTANLSATPIPLGGGWNWVAFLPTSSMSIATALASISGQVIEAKSRSGSATYNGGSWSGTLTQLEPGQGYSIKMSAPGTLIYPDVGAYNHTPILRKE